MRPDGPGAVGERFNRCLVIRRDDLDDGAATTSNVNHNPGTMMLEPDNRHDFQPMGTLDDGIRHGR